MRFLASVIDGLIVNVVVLAVVFPIAFLFGISATVSGGQGAEALTTTFMMAAMVAGPWLYHASLTSSAKQATLGKMAVGVIVSDMDGRRISFARATGRHFARYLSGLTLLIGYLIQPVTEKRQALHDLLAGTLVMRR